MAKANNARKPPSSSIIETIESFCTLVLLETLIITKLECGTLGRPFYPLPSRRIKHVWTALELLGLYIVRGGSSWTGKLCCHSVRLLITRGCCCAVQLMRVCGGDTVRGAL
jgi:hypothetical protein